MAGTENASVLGAQVQEDRIAALPGRSMSLPGRPRARVPGLPPPRGNPVAGRYASVGALRRLRRRSTG